ncbi:MAG: hypothetical protein HOP15_16990 [Planctomycetes bacterium]|nr:hypothetical protein [Planctomycetota bacterium]
MSLLGASASAQGIPGDAELRFVDTNEVPLPNDLFVIRGNDGAVLAPIVTEDGHFVLLSAGRKLTLEYTQKGLKTRTIELRLMKAPKVFVTLMLDPESGVIKELSQKPLYPNPIGRPKLKGGSLGLGGSQGSVIPPANDMCAAPTTVLLGATAFTSVDATTDGPANVSCGQGSQVSDDVWFKHTATGTGILTVETCGASVPTTYDTAIAVYNGLTCPPAAPIGCNDEGGTGCTPRSKMTVSVISGNQYLIRVGAWSSAGGEGSGTLTLTQAVPPANDECVGATPLACNSSVTVSNALATVNGTDPLFACRIGGPAQGFGTIWFSFVSPGTTATLDTSGSGVSDTLLAVYSGVCGALTQIACDDDAGAGLQSLVTATGLTPGNTYRVEVAGWSSTSLGSITLSLTCGAPPTPGNDCADAILTACDSSATWNNSTYTTDALDPAYSCRFGSPGQGFGTTWLKFVATDTSALLDTIAGAVNDTMLAVYSGTCGAFTEIACNDDAVGLRSEVCATGLTIGTTYYVQVSGFGALDVGSNTLTIQCPCPAPPANDDCATAEEIASLPASVTFDNSFATDDSPPPCGDNAAMFKNVWYSVTGTGNTMTASTCNAGSVVTDTRISVYCGDCLNLTCVGGDDDNCPSGGQIFQSTVDWCSQAGATYFITVGNFSATTTSGQIQLDVTEGGSCTATVQCLATGACCLPTGACVTTTADDCAAQGGVYQGDGTSCSANLIADGGFEDGVPNPSWVETSTNFGTPICDPGACGFGGGTGPRTGNFWAWFGGIPAFEVGTVSQSLVIPVGATTLDFYLEIPVSSGNGVDFLRVKIDATTVFSVGTPAGAIGYDLVSIPLGAFADGGVHTVLFESTQTGSPGVTNYFVDDVSINATTFVCPPPTGACCLADGSCVEVSEDDCATQGGTYNGDLSLCADVTCIQCFTLDFETDDTGAALLDRQRIDTEFNGGANYPVTITGSSYFGASCGSIGGTAAIYDSDLPPHGQDPDLAVNSGHILILQVDENLSECSPGFFCTGNDDPDGGVVTFSFSGAVTPGSIDLIDVDGGAEEVMTITLTDNLGDQLVYTVPVNWTGDGGQATLLFDGSAQAGPGPGNPVATAVAIGSYDANNVVSIVVERGSDCANIDGGSGALDNLTWCQ